MTSLFLYPRKTSENLRLSNICRGVYKETSCVKWGYRAREDRMISEKFLGTGSGVS